MKEQMKKQTGFTLLELIVTVAIVGIVFVVGARTSMTNSSKKKAQQNTATTITNTLSTQRNQALSRNTTSRMTITSAAGVYTMNTYVSTAATTTCSSAGTWTLLKTETISVDALYQITGSGMANTCFYRDGSSSGGQFVVSPITSTSETKTITIDVTIATGFLDVTTN
jgi:prepilin-type N-terminal cleavage/methylation domain-containing protein